jgi:hypothetical protein
MSREIKFKAWDNQKQRWAKESEVMESVGLEFGVKDFFVNVIGERMIRWSFCQFTGLYDKKEVPIYEGDLMDYGNGIAKEVSFLSGSFGVLNISPEGTSFGSYRIDNGVVVGNKYEHPNLLVPIITH